MTEVACMEGADSAKRPDAPSPMGVVQNVSETRGEHLVSEGFVDDLVESEVVEVEPTSPSAVPPSLVDLLDSLKAQGFETEIKERPFRDNPFVVVVELPAGRTSRKIEIDEGSATALAGVDLRRWRSLTKYDGIWSGEDGILEVALRGSRMGAALGTLIARSAGSSESGSDVLTILDVTDPEGFIRTTVGEPSTIGRALIGRGRQGPRIFVTLRVVGVSIATGAEADRIAEQVCDSISLDMHLTQGMLLVPRRLEYRSTSPTPRRRKRATPGFPRNSYPHAAVLLYQAGHETLTSPLIRYWSYYQVLEFFFNKYSQAEALQRLSRILKSPRFNPHRDEDVLRAVEAALSVGKSQGGEEEQLVATLRGVTTYEEVVRVVEDFGISEQLESKKSELSKHALRLDQEDALLAQLGRRIYDIRCRIVHSKSASARDSGPGLLPGTDHDDLVRGELPLLEYLAQQAILASAEPLSIPSRRE